MGSSIYIRVDGDSISGLGHIMRCFSLSQMLYPTYDVLFYSKEIPDSVKCKLEAKNNRVLLIDHEDDFLDSLTPNQVVVLDGYQFDITYQVEVKKKGAKIVFIDDFGGNDILADLIINHSFTAGAEQYKNIKNCILALGPKYALLQPAFLKKARFQKAKKFGHNLFICFGGADPQNLTLRVLKIAITLNLFAKIIIVTGASYIFKKSLDNYLNEFSNLKHHHSINSDKMFDLMNESDIGIVPASGILYEMMSLNKIIVTGMYIENQKLFLEGVKDLNNIINCNNFDEESLVDALQKAITSEVLPSDFFDGKSGDRILNLFKSL